MPDFSTYFTQVFSKLTEIANSLRGLERVSSGEISDGSTRIPYQEVTYTIAAGARVELFLVYNYFRVISQTSATTLSVRFGQNGIETSFSGQGIGVRFQDVFSRLTLINTSGISMTITVGTANGDISDDRLNVSGAIAINDITLSGNANSLGKTEDTPHTSGDIGVMPLGVRNDSLGTTIAAANGRYIAQSFDSKGSCMANPSGRIIAASQVSIGTSAIALVTANALNGEVLIKAGTADLFIGASSGVTTANGFLLAAGETMGFNGTMGDIFGIRAVASQTAYVIVGLR